VTERQGQQDDDFVLVDREPPASPEARDGEVPVTRLHADKATRDKHLQEVVVPPAPLP
jgi:hypothetical protein